jgi:hypothetical protein
MRRGTVCRVSPYFFNASRPYVPFFRKIFKQKCPISLLRYQIAAQKHRICGFGIPLRTHLSCSPFL